MRVRLKFEKLGALKFIGHLDFMRTFQKIFRQSNVPIAYSGGFNPRQICSIAAPLSVGLTSVGEYLDLELTQPMDLEQMIIDINKCCPVGLTILMAIPIDETEPPVMAAVSASRYRIRQLTPCFNQEQVMAFIQQETIVVKKTSKKGTISDVDLKPGISMMTYETGEIVMTLASGSVFNIKPDAVLAALSDFHGVAYNAYNFNVHREELYHGENPLIPLSTPIKQIF